MKRLEHAARAETVVLVCQECGEEMRVGENTDLEYISHQWALQSGRKSHREATADVFVIANHPHEANKLIDKATGEPWLKWKSNTGGPYGA